jgi:hypothetical protein
MCVIYNWNFEIILKGLTFALIDKLCSNQVLQDKHFANIMELKLYRSITRIVRMNVHL